MGIYKGFIGIPWGFKGFIGIYRDTMGIYKGFIGIPWGFTRDL